METMDEKIDLTNPWRGTDLNLIVEHKHLYVHRLILCLNSPVFDKMLNSDFKERSSEKIELPGKRYEEIKELLEMLYDRSKEITDSNFDFLLALAVEYQIIQLQSECIKYIKTADKSGILAIKFIKVLRKFNIKSLEELCLENIKSTSTETLNNSEEFQRADDVTKLLIVTSRTEHLEERLRDYEISTRSLLGRLYQYAHAAYIEQLRDKGYEESILSLCEKNKEHKNRKIGQKFDIECSACRNRVTMTKEFSLRTKEVIGLMDNLFELNHSI